MGNLRDQFQKANLLSKKDAKRLAHEERVARTEIGREGVAAAQQAHLAEVEALQAAQRAQQKLTQAQIDAERHMAEERAACEQILEQDLVRPSPHGRVRWYFTIDDGSLPWLELSEIDARRMQAGELAIARVGASAAHDYGMLAVAAAKRVAKLYPDKIAWWPSSVDRRGPSP